MSAKVVCACGFVGGPYATAARARAMAAKHVCKKDDGVRRATRRHRCARCGLEAVYENAGAAEARHWFSKHSCQKHEQAMLRAALHADRMALVDRTPKPCLHKIANHQHGTYAAYKLDGCRCEPCAQACSDYNGNLARQKAYGRYQRYVPAGPVREHVRTLMGAGMGLKRIVEVSGVSQGGLWKLMYGKRQPDGSQVPSRRVLRETAERLYALDPDWGGPLPLADGAILDEATSAAASRKLQALVALGWSMSEIGRRLGITYATNVIPIIKGERRLTVGTGKRATALFDDLCMTLPAETNQRERISASRARRYAAQHGWLPPLALEDDEAAETEDPGEDVDEVAIQRRMSGDRTVQLTKAEKTELARRWEAAGRPLNELERVTGINSHRYREKAS